ncbi:MAG: sigma-70 family RNA polymerase sigma factor [Cephaloticoccus sp.]|nr:sigma-70 family RNA polymerase sigma factor [Cephaloticoccus sp.]MCF7761745.1 sigma-70 family RNA polymerase sigma factor [Cephaloticoccus sp.]
MPVPENQTDCSEANLVHRAGSGDQVAFGILMQQHHDRIFRLVYSVVRHEQDARDVCQEVWLIVWRQIAHFRGDALFSTWLHSIAVRRALDYLRKRRRWYDRFLPLGRPEDNSAAQAENIPAPDQDEDPGQADRIARVRSALATLPAKHRAVLALRELEGLSYESIAAAMKIPSGTVMSRIYHARRLLAKKLGVKS